MNIRTFIVAILLAFPLSSKAQIITTYAGGGTDTADGIPATNARFDFISHIAVDKFGNLYLADWGQHKIRKVDANGNVWTIAGIGGWGGFSGDGGNATAAGLNTPTCVTTDTIGNIYFSDANAHRIRKINAVTGIILTIAGTGAIGFGGDGGSATAAMLHAPYGIFWDRCTGNLYFADGNNNRLRMVDPAGIIHTVAGNGLAVNSGDGAPATGAACIVYGVVGDALGNLYISNDRKVRRINPAGIISTVGGFDSCYTYNGDGIPAVNACMNPIYLGIANTGLLYLPDLGNNRVRKIDSVGVIHTVAGNGSLMYSGDSGLATSAGVASPYAIAFDKCNNMYISEVGSMHIIRKVIVDSSCSYAPSMSIGAATNREKTNYRVYPNPVTDCLHVDKIDGIVSYRLLSLTGVELYNGELETGANNIATDHLSKGLYFLQLQQTDGNKDLIKIVKE